MDIARPDLARKRRRKRILYSALGLGALIVITIGLSRLKPAAPLVENPYTDTVKRGDLPRQVRGNGTLVPEEILWIPTLSAGRVQKIMVLPGAAVKADTVLVELNNPEVEQAAFDAEWAHKAGGAELTGAEDFLRHGAPTEPSPKSPPAGLRPTCALTPFVKLDAAV